MTGSVGSGKTTLLRTVLGLLPTDAGELRWNGRSVPEPESFMVPPRVAYVSQVPRLFSETLDENLRLGWETLDGEVATALELSVFERDVAEMPDRLDTVVGSRGTRLSGGQAGNGWRPPPPEPGRRRSWWSPIVRPRCGRRIRSWCWTAGRVAATGTLEELLATSPEMRRLWADGLLETETP